MAVLFLKHVWRRMPRPRSAGNSFPPAGLAIFTTLSLLAFPLAAGPVLKIESIDTGAYPELEVRAALHYPYPERMEDATSHFTVRERPEAGPPDLYNDATLRTIQELPAPETRLYLVLVVDTTRSVPKQAFRKSIAAATGLVREMKPGESTAVYRINARPLLASGFTTDRKSLETTLSSFKRTGRVTRLYDSLHAAVLTAHRTYVTASQKQPAVDGVRERTAIVLLTDGRDEGSFLTDNDCAELAALSHSYDIPIYTVLYGNSENLAALTRLSARTGGVLIRGFDMERIEAIPDELRRPRARYFRLRYESSADPGGWWPVGQAVGVNLGWNAVRSRDGAQGSYRIPFPGGLTLLTRRPNSWMYLAGAGLLLLGFLLLLLLVLLLAARSNRRRRNARAMKRRAMDPEPDPFPETPLPRPEAEHMEPPEMIVDDSVPPIVEEDEDFFVDTVSEAGAAAGPIVPAETVDYDDMAMDQAAYVDRHGENLMAAEVLRERRRIVNPVRETQSELYMRDYSYRMLQNALRQARRYSEATLMRETSHGKSEYDVFLETTILGTGRWANIHLEDPSASPIHAKIRQVDHKFVIYDMLSAAGVFVNGRKILRPMALADGDQIQLGRTKLTFRGVV